jgi:hypothetical protein
VSSAATIGDDITFVTLGRSFPDSREPLPRRHPSRAAGGAQVCWRGVDAVDSRRPRNAPTDTAPGPECGFSSQTRGGPKLQRDREQNFRPVAACGRRRHGTGGEMV